MDISPFPTQKKQASHPEPPLEIVSEALETDVLFGRDKVMFNHVGNVRFRLVIQSRAKEYEHAPSRRVKSRIVYSVVQNVHGYGGRFLKKAKNGKWMIVTVTEAIQKVGHALRDKKQHDHKMKAKLCEPQPLLPLTTKNKSLEGGCDLLLKLGEVCAKEMGVTHQSSNYPGQEEKSSGVEQNYLKRPIAGAIAEQTTKKRPMYHHQEEDESTDSSGDEDAANCILALGGAKRAATATRPAEVCSSHQISLASRHHQDTQESWSTHGGRPMGPPPGAAQHMSPPVQAMRVDSLYLAQQQIAKAHLTAKQRMVAQQHHGHMKASAHGHPSMMRLPRNNAGGISAQARALLQAQRMNQQMNSLMQAAAGVVPRMGGGFGFGNAPTMPVRRASDHEGSRPVTPPPIIHTDKKDDDGHWIFYPIKVPNLKLAGSGWKLALMPIDGKGKPIELDPTNIHFPEV